MKTPQLDLSHAVGHRLRDLHSKVAGDKRTYVGDISFAARDRICSDLREIMQTVDALSLSIAERGRDIEATRDAIDANDMEAIRLRAYDQGEEDERTRTLYRDRDMGS